ncbi:MAG: hypothetical protein ACLGHN_02230 [Bacteriovoracia bacterium]
MKKRSKLKRLTPFVIGTCMLTLAVSCGSDDDDSGSGVPQQQQEEQQQEGQFRVVLSPVNANVAADATGTGSFLIEGDQFGVNLDVTGASRGAHRQFVHVGTVCPTPDSDTNGDGYIDATEAMSVSGGRIIPLDSDLRAQRAGGRFPMGGNYQYQEETSFQTMLQELRLPDTDTEDNLVKLGADENLNLEGKVVMVHGIPSSTTLPPTVQGVEGGSPQQTLPVLCGVITREDTGTTTTGETGTTTGETGTTTGETGTTTGETGTTTGETDPQATTTGQI